MPEFEIERLDVSTKGQKLLWCPFGEFSKTEMPTRGHFVDIFPRGLTVHFSAGRSLNGDKDSENCIAYGAKQGYAYWCISRDGSIFMSHPLNKYGWHNGKSEWKGHSSISKYNLGVEINCAGRLDKKGEKFYSWFGEEIPNDEVRFSNGEENIQKGHYHKYTKAQEASLIKLCLWMKSNNPDVFDFDWVVGHDETSPSRKQDPGSSLSITMPEFRQLLNLEYSKI